MTSTDFRTPLMKREEAFELARAFEADPQWTDVFVEPKANNRFVVTYRPANSEGWDVKRTQMLQASATKALEEGRYYLWDPDESGRYFRLESNSRETYDVASDGSDCSCPHHRTRCAPVGASCKHIVALKLGLGKRTDGKPMKVGVLL